jgi:hypothetical protein
MLIITKVSSTPEGSDGTCTRTITATHTRTITATYSAPLSAVSHVYDYDDDSGPRMNHSAAMRRLAETFVGKDMAYDGEWVGIMTSSTTCAWTRKSYTIS